MFVSSRASTVSCREDSEDLGTPRVRCKKPILVSHINNKAHMHFQAQLALPTHCQKNVLQPNSDLKSKQVCRGQLLVLPQTQRHHQEPILSAPLSEVALSGHLQTQMTVTQSRVTQAAPTSQHLLHGLWPRHVHKYVNSLGLGVCPPTVTVVFRGRVPPGPNCVLLRNTGVASGSALRCFSPRGRWRRWRRHGRRRGHAQGLDIPGSCSTIVGPDPTAQTEGDGQHERDQGPSAQKAEAPDSGPFRRTTARGLSGAVASTTADRQYDAVVSGRKQVQAPRNNRRLLEGHRPLTQASATTYSSIVSLHNKNCCKPWDFPRIIVRSG